MPLIRGRIVDPSGNPVAGARVMVAGGPVPVPDIALLSGPDGSFALSVPATGVWQLVTATDDARATADVRIDADAGAVRCTLTLPPK